MQEQVNKIEKNQIEQGVMINKIYDSLVGDEFNEGLVSEVRSNSSHRKNSIKTNGFIAGCSIVFGGVLGKFWDSIANILH